MLWVTFLLCPWVPATKKLSNLAKNKGTRYWFSKIAQIVATRPIWSHCMGHPGERMNLINELSAGLTKQCDQIGWFVTTWANFERPWALNFRPNRGVLRSQMLYFGQNLATWWRRWGAKTFGNVLGSFEKYNFLGTNCCDYLLFGTLL